MKSRPAPRATLKARGSPQKGLFVDGCFNARRIGGKGLLGALLYCCLGAAWVSGAELLARRVVLPTYLAGMAEPAAVTRMAWMEKDYYRRGFLQFGVLPITVARDVMIEVRQPAALGPALEAAQGWSKAPGRGRAVELRGFCLRVLQSDGIGELRAGLVRFGRHGTLILSEGVTWSDAGMTPQAASEAVLNVIGPQAGILLLHRGEGEVEHPLFGKRNLPGGQKEPIQQTKKEPL